LLLQQQQPGDGAAAAAGLMHTLDFDLVSL
jgi:hypothetical protein